VRLPGDPIGDDQDPADNTYAKDPQAMQIIHGHTGNKNDSRNKGYEDPQPSVD